jgi:hypothetical protein
VRSISRDVKHDGIGTMAKEGWLSVRVPAATKKAIEKAARDEHRSVASQVEKILTDWLREREYLAK